MNGKPRSCGDGHTACHGTHILRARLGSVFLPATIYVLAAFIVVPYAGAKVGQVEISGFGFAMLVVDALTSSTMRGCNLARLRSAHAFPPNLE